MRTHSIVVPFTPETLNTYVDQLEAMAIALAAEFTPPDQETRRRLVRPNPARARQLMPLLTRIAARFKISSASMPVTDMAEKLAFADSLRPLAEQSELVNRLLRDMIFVAEADAWSTLLATYGALNAESRHNGLLDRALTPVRDALTPTRRHVVEALAEPAAPADGEGVTQDRLAWLEKHEMCPAGICRFEARRERAFCFCARRCRAPIAQRALDADSVRCGSPCGMVEWAPCPTTRARTWSFGASCQNGRPPARLTRFSSRRSDGSKARRECSVVWLSQNTMSPTSQSCS